MLCHHLGGVSTIIGQVGGAHVVAQTPFDGTCACNALLQHLDADAKVGHRVERCKVPTEILVLLRMHTGHHLHQALRTDRALGKRIEVRLDGHDGEDEGRIQLGACANVIRLGHQNAQGLWSHLVLFAQPKGHSRLLFGQVLGVACRSAFAGVGLYGHADGCDLSLLQPVHELLLSCLAQIRARSQCDRNKGNSQADEGKAVVGDFKKTIGHIGHEGS